MQPAKGYRAGTDAVLLAATIPTHASGHALDVGCGVGTIGLLAMQRAKSLQVTGLEQDEFIADLARQNLAGNQLSMRGVILHGDLFSDDHGLEVETFDWVITNPPYFSRQHHQLDDYRVRARALPQNLTLAQWAYKSLLLLRHGGWLHMVVPAQDLPEILVMLDGRAGNVLCKPVLSKLGQPANRILLAARRNAKGPFQLLSPLVMHEDDGSYSAQAEAIARDGEILEDFAKLC